MSASEQQRLAAELERRLVAAYHARIAKPWLHGGTTADLQLRLAERRAARACAR